MHGDWVTQHQPQFGPGVKERFAMASQLTSDEVEEALRARGRIRCVSSVMEFCLMDLEGIWMEFDFVLFHPAVFL